jgi:hypothetical protein
MASSQLLIQLCQLHANDFEAALLQASEDRSDEAALNRVRLKDN